MMAVQESEGCHARVDKHRELEWKVFASSSPPAPSFLDFFHLLPFQIKKFGLRNPG